MCIVSLLSFWFGAAFQLESTGNDIKNIIKSYNKPQITRDEKIIIITLESFYEFLFKNHLLKHRWF